MPEGDSIHRLAKKLSPLLTGEVIRDGFARAQGPLSTAVGERVERVHARGKHLFIELTGGWTLRVHLGIGGRCRQYPSGGWQGHPWSASLWIKTDAHDVVFHKAPQAMLERTAHVRAVPGIRRLGPDLLAAEIDLDDVVRRARHPALAERAVGELLLDQSIAAGIGNAYKSEIMFLLRLDPWTATQALDDDTVRRAYALARELMQQNLGGGPRITVRPEHRLVPGITKYVYGRTGQACLLCGARVGSQRQGEQARMTYYCPRCQGVSEPPGGSAARRGPGG